MCIRDRASQLTEIDYLQTLLTAGGDPNTLNYDGEPLTKLAHLQRAWPNIQLLIEQGADVHGGTDNPLLQPIAWFSGLRQFDKVYWLLERGADPTGRVFGKHHPTDGTPIVVADIYWQELPAEATDMREWQLKSRQWLADRNIPKPPKPAALK